MHTKAKYTLRRDFTLAMEAVMCSQHPETPTNHSHKCERCGAIWSHTEKSLDCVECHTCPRCATENFVVHEFASREAEEVFDEARGVPRGLRDLFRRMEQLGLTPK